MKISLIIWHMTASHTMILPSSMGCLTWKNSIYRSLGYSNLIQLSPLLECDPTVCLPEKGKVTRGLAQGWPNFSRGDKPSGHTPTSVIIGILYWIFLHQTPSNRIPAALRKIFDIICKISSSPTATNLSLDAMFVVCWIKGSNYNWKREAHVGISLGFPHEQWTLRLAVDPTNG